MQQPGPLSNHRKLRFQKLFSALRKRRSSADDQAIAEIHDAVFSNTDCLQCAQCCKSYPPILEGPDIKRIARHLNLSEAQFMGNYLIMDEDGDWVMYTTPCPFLQSDNKCQIYDVRPKACREYPHTNRKKIYQIEALTLVNATICPAVSPILERMAEQMQIS